MNISICLIERRLYVVMRMAVPMLPAVNDSIAVLHFCGEATMKNSKGCPSRNILSFGGSVAQQ